MPRVPWRMLHPRACPMARWAEKDPLAGAVMWAHDAQVHMLVLPAQRANSEAMCLRAAEPGVTLVADATHDQPVTSVGGLGDLGDPARRVGDVDPVVLRPGRAAPGRSPKST